VTPRPKGLGGARSQRRRLNLAIGIKGQSETAKSLPGCKAVVALGDSAAKILLATARQDKWPSVALGDHRTRLIDMSNQKTSLIGKFFDIIANKYLIVIN